MTAIRIFRPQQHLLESSNPLLLPAHAGVQKVDGRTRDQPGPAIHRLRGRSTGLEGSYDSLWGSGSAPADWAPQADGDDELEQDTVGPTSMFVFTTPSVGSLRGFIGKQSLVWRTTYGVPSSV